MTDHSALIERLEVAVTAMKRRADEGWKMMPSVPNDDMTEALERCESYCDSCHGTAFSGWSGYEAMFKGAPDAILMLDVLAEAAAALRDQQDRHEGMEEDLYQAVLVAYRRGAVEWTRLNYPQWFDAISAGREVCPLPSAPNQAKEAGE